MSCNRIIKAITNRMPPKCFNCCVWDWDDEWEKGYCWLLHRKTAINEKPDDCPLESYNSGYDRDDPRLHDFLLNQESEDK